MNLLLLAEVNSRHLLEKSHKGKDEEMTERETMLLMLRTNVVDDERIWIVVIANCGVGLKRRRPHAFEPAKK